MPQKRSSGRRKTVVADVLRVYHSVLVALYSAAHVMDWKRGIGETSIRGFKTLYTRQCNRTMQSDNQELLLYKSHWDCHMDDGDGFKFIHEDDDDLYNYYNMRMLMCVSIRT